MKKNSLEQKRKQYASLVAEEKARMAKQQQKQTKRAEKVLAAAEVGEVEMSTVKQKFRKGRILPRRIYKANRRQARLAKYAPLVLSSDGGDIDMAGGVVTKKKISKTLRLVKDKDSIAKMP